MRNPTAKSVTELALDGHICSPKLEECWPCEPRGRTKPIAPGDVPNGRPAFFHLFSIDAVSADSIDIIDVELPNGKIVRYVAPIAGEILSERPIQSIAAAKCIGRVKRPWLKCAECGLASDALAWVTICDPGQQPIRAWLHRECESAFLRSLDDKIISDAKAMRKAS